MLKSIRDIWQRTAENVNAFDTSKNPQSALELAKRGILAAMRQMDSSRKPDEQDLSSGDSAAEGHESDNLYHVKALDDYLHERSMSAIKTNIGNRDQLTLTYDDLSKIYLDAIDKYLPSKGLTKYQARIDFLMVAFSILTNISSSSELERKFGECMRSISDRRVKLRKIFL